MFSSDESQESTTAHPRFSQADIVNHEERIREFLESLMREETVKPFSSYILAAMDLIWGHVESNHKLFLEK